MLRIREDGRRSAGSAGRPAGGLAMAVLVLIALMLAGCPPAPPVVEPTTPTGTVWVEVWDGAHPGAKVPGALVTLDAPAGTTPPQLTADASGNAGFVNVPMGPRHLWVSAAGFEPTDRHLEVPAGELHVGITLTPLAIPVPVLPRIAVWGREFVAGDQPWAWRGLTAFALLEQIATGREAEAMALLGWAHDHGVTIVRVLAMKAHGGAYGDLFSLTPAAGRSALGRLLELAARAGVYVQVVALADTTAYPIDLVAQVTEIGRLCAAFSACAVLELANEPWHPTQLEALHDPGMLRQLRTLIPEDVPVALGAAEDDESDVMADGADLVVVHFSRADGDAGWRWVRHAREGWDLSVRIRKPVVNNEPKRDDLQPDKHFGLGAAAAMLWLGDTFHYAGGLLAVPPAGAELAAFEARRAGWQAFEGWHGDYWATHSGSPIKGYDTTAALRAWNSVAGDQARGLLLHVTADPRVELEVGWRRLDSQQFGQVQIWRLAREE